MLPAEPVPEETEERHGIAHHPLQADASPVLPFPQRPTAAALVPVDDCEGLFQAEEVLEAAYFVDHRQAGTLLDQQQHRVGSVRPRTRIHWVVSPAWIASSESIAILAPGTATRSPASGPGRWPGPGGRPRPGHERARSPGPDGAGVSC